MAEPNEQSVTDSDDLDSLLEEYSKQTETESKPEVKVSDHIKPNQSTDGTQAEILEFIRQQKQQQQVQSDKEVLGKAVSKFKENEFFSDIDEQAIEEMIAGKAWRDEKFLNVMQSGDAKAINKAVSKLAEERAKALKKENEDSAKSKEAVRAAVSGINETPHSGDEDEEVSPEKLHGMSDWEFAQFKRKFPRE